MKPSPKSSRLWASLDDYDEQGGWDETEDEVEAYHKEVSQQIADKLDEMGKIFSNAKGAQAEILSEKELLVCDIQAVDDVKEGLRDNLDPIPAKASEPSFPIPSFHTSHIIDTSTPRPLRSTTLPTVSTPNIDTPPALRPLRKATTPVAARVTRRMSISTPADVPSPSNTPIAPTASKVSMGEGKGKRDDPTTPIPLGTGGLENLKGKKDYQTLTDHFQQFEKGIAKVNQPSDTAAKGKGKGKGRAAVKAPKTAGLGGKVLSGLRFCIPPELNNVSKHRRWWAIISELDGQVTITPDTATTHVISENRTASELIKDLGLNALSELPEGAACVKWNYVAQCKLTGTVLDVSPFLSFPRNAFSKLPYTRPQRNASRLADITAQLKGPSISISKKREHTASDSETGSPQKPKRPPSDLQMIKPPTPKKKKSNPWYAPGDVADVPTVDTNHAIATGTGWREGAKGEWDALDEMISGVQAGTATEENDDEIEDDSISASPKEEEHNPCLLGDQFRCGQKNDGAQLKGPNEWLAKKFEEMHDMYEGMQGKSFFSVRQYRQAAGIMRRTEFEITSGSQARLIKGIGQSIADRIDEFIKGGPGRLYYENTEQMQTIQLFKDIYGVGKIVANQLYTRGARTIDDLRTKDYGLTAGQKIGLDLYDDLKTRIPREECREIFEIVRNEARIIDKSLWIDVMGSYRRGAETSGDIDMLITRDTADGKDHAGVLPKLVRKLKEMGIITHDLSVPHDWNALEAKWMGVGRLSDEGKYRRIDILCIPFDQWGAALIYFTGNDIFNRSLRLYARKKGYSLNQRGLSRGVIRGQDGLKLTEGEIVASRTEQEIFGMLGLRWRHPFHRCP